MLFLFSSLRAHFGLEVRSGLCWGKGRAKQVSTGDLAASRALAEVDTIPEERRKKLATAACSALILNCLEEGLYPSWDAQNMNSVRLAEKLGYEYDHEYVAYEVD